MMRVWMLLALLSVAACTSAEDKQRRRELAMVEAAKADAQDEAAFVADSVAVLQSITVDTVTELQMRLIDDSDEVGYTHYVTQYVAMSPRGNRCMVDSTKYGMLVRGDTLSCQWGPPE
jgi:hypothetical protein